MSTIVDDVLVGEEDGLQHVFFGHFAGKALDHGDRVARAGHDQVEIALFELASASASHISSLSMRPTRTAPVGLKKGICERCRAPLEPIMRENVRVVLLVGREDGSHDLHFVDDSRRERAGGSADR